MKRRATGIADPKNEYGQPIGPPVANWSQRPMPQRRTLPGQYCRLEPVHQHHARDLFAAYSEAPDDRDWTYLFAERPATEAAFRGYLVKLVASADPLHFAIIDTTTGKPVGTAALMRIDPVHGVIEVGCIAFSPRMKKTRVGTESMYLFMRLVFDELGYRRYEWKCDSHNAPSRSAAQRYGFLFEGVFRRAIVYKKRSRDTAWFSTIAEEWPQTRRAFEAWLDAKNFDDLGHQKHSLSSIRESL